MATRLQCPTCGAIVAIRGDARGMVRCRQCKEQIPIPDSPADATREDDLPPAQRRDRRSGAAGAKRNGNGRSSTSAPGSSKLPMVVAAGGVIVVGLLLTFIVFRPRAEPRNALSVQTEPGDVKPAEPATVPTATLSQAAESQRPAAEGNGSPTSTPSGVIPPPSQPQPSSSPPPEVAVGFRDGDVLAPAVPVIPTAAPRMLSIAQSRAKGTSSVGLQPVIMSQHQTICLLTTDPAGRVLAAHGRPVEMSRELRLSPLPSLQAAAPAPRTLLGIVWLKHASDAMDATFSPDGETLVTTEGRLAQNSSRGSAHFWKGMTGERDGDSLEFDGPARRAQFISGGHRLVVTASNPDLKADRGSFKPSDAVHVFDLPSRRKAFASLDHVGAVDLISVSRDGRLLLAAGGLDHRARVWSLTNGKPFGKLLEHDGGVTAAELSPDGKTALTASYDGSLRLWNLETKREQARPIEVSDFRSRRWVERLAVHWDARRFATADAGGLVRLWTLPAAGTVGSPFEHKQPLASVEFSPDGKLLLTASTDGVVRLWAADDGTAIGPPLLETGLCHAAKFSADGRLILVSTPNGIRAWRSPAQ